MIDRYAVRRYDDGFGVWDSRTNGWRTEKLDYEPDAVEISDRMNLEETDANAPDVRQSVKVHPARDVLVKSGETWYPGLLYQWVRETDGWYGWATIGGADTKASWFPASALRPLE